MINLFQNKNRSITVKTSKETLGQCELAFFFTSSLFFRLFFFGKKLRAESENNKTNYFACFSKHKIISRIYFPIKKTRENKIAKSH